MNVTADPTTPGGLGTFGFDDEGVPAAREPIVAEGVLRGFLTSRETAARSARARRLDARRRLEPDAARADDEPPPRAGRGLARGADRRRRRRALPRDEPSWSIDDKRLNFQFGTQVAWEIKDGKLGRMLATRPTPAITPRLLGLARRGRRAATNGGCTG